MAGLGKNQAIKSTVEDVANGPCQNQPEAGQYPKPDLFIDELADEKNQKYDGSNAEQAQRQFAVISPQVPAKGHSIVFHKMKQGPIQSQDFNFSPVFHMGFDADL